MDLNLSLSDRLQLRVWSRQRDRWIPPLLRGRLAIRAQAILILAKENTDHRLKAISAKTGLSSATVMRLRDRVVKEGIAALTKGLASGRRVDPRVKTNLKAELAAPSNANGEKHPTTTRALAAKYFISQSTASRLIKRGSAR